MNTLSKLSVIVFGTCSITLANVAKAEANLVLNGGFESPTVNTISGNSFLFFQGDASDVATSIAPDSGKILSNWLVEDAVNAALTGNIDLYNNDTANSTNALQSFEGSQSIDLDGNQPSSIYQSISTTPGQGYFLSFAYSANPAIRTEPTAIQSRTIRVDFGGYSTTVAYDTSVELNTETNMKWKTALIGVPGSFISSSSTLLRFTSTTPSRSTIPSIFFGPQLDDVVVTPVPFEFSPALGLGALGALYAGRRLRKSWMRKKLD